MAQEIWNLLARDNIAAGSIDQLIESLPKTPAGKGKARQQWLIKPDRSRALDVEFLNFLDEARRELGFDLIRNNDRADLLEGNQLNEAVQRIIDRILFLRICETATLTRESCWIRSSKPGSEITTRKTWFAPTKSLWNCTRNRLPASVQRPARAQGLALARHRPAFPRAGPPPAFPCSLLQRQPVQAPFQRGIGRGRRLAGGVCGGFERRGVALPFQLHPGRNSRHDLRAISRQGRPPARPRRHHRGKARSPKSRRGLLHPALHRRIHRGADRREACCTTPSRRRP